MLTFTNQELLGNTSNFCYLVASSSSCENEGSDGSYFGRNIRHGLHFPTSSAGGVGSGFLASPYTSAQSVCDTRLSPEVAETNLYYKGNFNNYCYQQQQTREPFYDFQFCRPAAIPTRRYSDRGRKYSERSRLLPTGSTYDMYTPVVFVCLFLYGK